MEEAAKPNLAFMMVPETPVKGKSVQELFLEPGQWPNVGQYDRLSPHFTPAKPNAFDNCFAYEKQNSDDSDSHTGDFNPSQAQDKQD